MNPESLRSRLLVLPFTGRFFFPRKRKYGDYKTCNFYDSVGPNNIAVRQTAVAVAAV